MTALTDFYDRVKSVVNESTVAMDTLVPMAVEHAVRTLERQFKFAYLRRIEYRQLRVYETTPSVIATYENTTGYTNVIMQTDPAMIPPQVGITWFSDPPTQGFKVGDYIRFNGIMSVDHGLDAYIGTYGQIQEIILGPAPVTTYIIYVPDSSITGAFIDFQPIGFKLELMSGNPFNIADYDPGVVAFGRHAFEIECQDVCDPDNYRIVLRKNLEAFDMKAISKENDSWDQSVDGTVPAMYTILGSAEEQAPELLGSLQGLDPEESILLLRPKPDKSYWLRSTVWRYSEWPQDDHWLLGPAQDVLLYQTIVELSPALRDKDLMQMGAGMLAQKLQALGISNQYHRASGDTRRMEYDAYRDQNR